MGYNSIGTLKKIIEIDKWFNFVLLITKKLFLINIGYLSTSSCTNIERKSLRFES